MLGVEADPAAAALAGEGMALRSIAGAPRAGRRALGDRLVTPGAADRERLIEHGDEMQRV
nr:hypothetical protein [Tanacetum cinerariifolium]